jgi:hypothetical protein
MPSSFDEISLEELRTQYAELLCLREYVEWLENRRDDPKQGNWTRKGPIDATEPRKRRSNTQSRASIRLQ